MSSILKQMPVWLIIALGLKASILGINISDALVGVSLVGLLCLREWMDKHKTINEVESHVARKMEEMKNAINAQNAVITEQAKEFDKLRNSMTGIKLQYGQKESTGGIPRKLG